MRRLREALGRLPWAVVRLSMRDEQALVSGNPRRWRWLTVRLAGWFVVLLLAGVYVNTHLTGGTLTLVVAGLLGLAGARAAMATVGRARAYRNGWLSGRQAMVYALVEAQRRGMTPGEWLTAQLEADLALLGVDPGATPRAPEDE